MARNYNLEELRALSSAFGEKESQTKFNTFIFLPFGISMGTFYIFLTPLIPFKSPIDFVLVIFGLLFGGLGALFGWRQLLPQIVERDYQRKQFNEKHRFVNTLTQLMVDEQRSVWLCLKSVSERVDGQFKTDLEILVARLKNPDEAETRASFSEFSARYKDDIFFVQYVDELSSSFLEGRGNFKTLQELKDSYNDIKLKQEAFYTRKKAVLSMAFKVYFSLLGFVMVFHFLPPIASVYAPVFSHSILGWIDFSLFYVIMLWFFNKLSIGFFDDNLLQMQK
ncbi:hypothetical protein [Lactovum miscens]|uniref:Type II secretion system protein GspF domain-containing protein n=1 Tax=Lactovum miscens TaxID=190387 RepID=A0A841C7P2_9LACT|nr:hypothetical protein [Lactovum miscens]MBB5887612.1 hypothetical protein [Lactovum miscens]